MGDKAGYRIRDGDEVSNLIRKQWQIEDIEDLVTNVAKTLLESYKGQNVIGDGGVALRNDLDIGRLTAALYHVVYEPPFDSIETNPMSCDISDNGLYEIELVEWNHWKVFNYAFGWKDDDIDLFDACLIAEVTFTEGKSLSNGIKFEVKA